MSLIWDELYFCEPRSELIRNGSCPCGKCFDKSTDMLDEFLSEEKLTATSAKCRAIPPHIIFFCQHLHSLIEDKFPQCADTVVADFLFNRWILKALCEDGNKNGLITSLPISGILQTNLSLVQMALTALISTDSDYQNIISNSALLP